MEIVVMLKGIIKVFVILMMIYGFVGLLGGPDPKGTASLEIEGVGFLLIAVGGIILFFWHRSQNGKDKS